MNYHHFTILFVIILVAFGLGAQISVSGYRAAADNYDKVERAFHEAVDKAGEALCRYGHGVVTTDKESAHRAFFDSLSASLGILDNPEAREELKNYIPMFAVLEEEGFSIYFEDEYMKPDGYTYGTRTWTDSMPYSHSDTDFVYRFTLSGEVTIWDRNGLINGTPRMYNATFNELKEDALYAKLRRVRPDSFLFHREKFGIVKQTAVIESVTEQMRYYVNAHNEKAREVGIAYNFALPIFDNSLRSRSIDHPGVLVMIQGYPVDVAKHVVYNQYAFVGAQIYRQEPYYLSNEWGWHPVYHRRGCDVLSLVGEETFLDPIYSVEECVKRGAYACTECIPDGVYPPETIYPIWTWE